MKNKKCLKCGKQLMGNQKKYCSGYCSKLHLKSEYRKRRNEQINLYEKEYRKKNKRIRRVKYPDTKKLRKEYLKDKCEICGTTNNLTLNHIIPRKIEGDFKKANMETLCRSCNAKEYQELVKDSLRFYFENNGLPLPHYPTWVRDLVNDIYNKFDRHH